MVGSIYLVTYSNFDTPQVFRLPDRDSANQIFAEMKQDVLQQRPLCKINEDEDCICFEWHEDSEDFDYVMYGYVLEEINDDFPEQTIKVDALLKYLRKNYNFQEETLRIIKNALKLLNDIPFNFDNDKTDYILDVLDGFDIPRDKIERFVEFITK